MPVLRLSVWKKCSNFILGFESRGWSNERYCSVIKPFNMKVISFNRENKAEFEALLERAKDRLLELCQREINGSVNSDVSVIRYNMARQEMKSEFPLEVIGMLDASGFINSILCPEERMWLRARKERSLSSPEWQAFLRFEKKGGQS